MGICYVLLTNLLDHVPKSREMLEDVSGRSKLTGC